METRVAAISIIVENQDNANAINEILSENSKYIVGRMGIPYNKRSLSIISIVIDAPQDVISTMAGKIGKLKGVSAKTAYSKYVFNND